MPGTVSTPAPTSSANVQTTLNRWPSCQRPMNGIKNSDSITSPGTTIAPTIGGNSSKYLSVWNRNKKYDFGPRGRVAFRRIGRRTEFAPKLRASSGRPLRPRIVPQDEHQHHDRHGEAGDRVAQQLLGPESGVRAPIRLANREAVPAEQQHVQRQKDRQQRRQHAGVQREEARQRVMAVVAAADDDLLQRLADDRHERHHVRGDASWPNSLFDPTAAGSR